MNSAALAAPVANTKNESRLSAISHLSAEENGEKRMTETAKTYEEFISDKVAFAKSTGIAIDPSEVHPILKPHQRDTVVWACRGGRRGIFMRFGLGKSLIQLSICDLMTKHIGEHSRALIVCPLGVRQEFARDAKMIGLRTEFIQSNAEKELLETQKTFHDLGRPIYTTNYESIRCGKLDPTGFDVICLDEAAILRGFGSTLTFRKLMGQFEGSSTYRFVSTATPDPNEYLELAAYADWLGVMETGEIKTRWFKRDSTKADNLTLHTHKADEFWHWVSTWALFVQKPSDLGYSDEGYDLPPLTVNWHEIPTDHARAIADRSGQRRMFNDAAMGLSEAAAEKRNSLSMRVERICLIIKDIYGTDSLKQRDTCDERRGEKGIHEGVLQSEPGFATCSTEGEGQEELRTESSRVQSQEQAVERGESRKIQIAHKEVRGQEQGETAKTQRGLVCEQQRASEGDVQKAKARELRTDARAIPENDEKTKERLCDLRRHSGEGEPSSGSLSPNEASERATLPQLQRGTRCIQGQSKAADRGGEVFELPQVIIWCDLNDEQKAIEHALEAREVSYVSLYGSQAVDVREKMLESWRRKEVSVFLSKPSMYGAGINMQQAHFMIFAGIGFKFNELMQGIHRVYRFLQDYPVSLHLIYTEAEIGIRKVLEDKWSRYTTQCENMANIIRQHGLAATAMSGVQRTFAGERREFATDKYRVINNDCVRETTAMPDASVHLIVTSIPFSFQYEYSPCYDDQTEVLTRRGWLNFGDLRTDDIVATVNPKSLQLEWQSPSAIIWRKYSGPMLKFSERNSFDLAVTPDHKMFVDCRVGNLKTGRKRRSFGLLLASEMAANFKPRKWVMATTVTSGDGNWPEKIQIPSIGKRSSKRDSVTEIRTSDLMELAGWYLSEGCVGHEPKSATCDRCGETCKPDARWCSTYCRNLAAIHRKSGEGTAEYQKRITPRRRARTSGKRGVISISQYRSVHPEYWSEIRDLLNRIGLRARATDKTFDVWDINLAEFLRKEFGSGSASKKIPFWVKDLHPDLLRTLRDSMMKGDGNSTGFAYTSISQQLRDDFQEVCILTGWRAEVVRHGTGKGRVVNIGKTNLFPQVRHAPKEFHYDGMIGCATVPNHTLIVRRNGCAVVSGNCWEDFGHTDSNDHFWSQMDFLTPQLFRVMQPGRVAAIHVKDRIVPGGLSGFGFQTLHPFHAEAIAHYTKHGFAFLGMKTVVTDVVRENNQTYRLGWSEQCKDGSRMGCGVPEYVLLFRRPPTDRSNGYGDVPIVKSKPQTELPDGTVVDYDYDGGKIVLNSGYSRARWQLDAHGFQRSSGNRLLTSAEMDELPHADIYRRWREESLNNVYDLDRHVELGEQMERGKRLPSTFMQMPPHSWHPDVWSDITRMRTLNMLQQRKGQQQHLCPLQFDIVNRLINQLSMPGEVVYDPFGGLMTVPYCAIQLKRFGLGVELNPGYFDDGARYCESAVRNRNVPTLFDIPNEDDLDADNDIVEPLIAGDGPSHIQSRELVAANASANDFSDL